MLVLKIAWILIELGLAEADSGSRAGARAPPIFCNHLVFLQSL